VAADGGPGEVVAAAFHLGTVGGSGRNVRRLNARKVAHLDRVIDAAVALTAARAEVARLRARLDGVGPATQPAPTKAQPRSAKEAPADAARLSAIAEWYLHGDADAVPPFADITYLLSEFSLNGPALAAKLWALSSTRDAEGEA
jgi:hypothetical protein